MSTSAINKHLKNTFKSVELKDDSIVSKMETVQQYEEYLYKWGPRQGFSYRENFGNSTRRFNRFALPAGRGFDLY